MVVRQVGDLAVEDVLRDMRAIADAGLPALRDGVQTAFAVEDDGVFHAMSASHVGDPFVRHLEAALRVSRLRHVGDKLAAPLRRLHRDVIADRLGDDVPAGEVFLDALEQGLFAHRAVWPLGRQVQSAGLVLDAALAPSPLGHQAHLLIGEDRVEQCRRPVRLAVRAKVQPGVLAPRLRGHRANGVSGEEADMGLPRVLFALGAEAGPLQPVAEGVVTSAEKIVERHLSHLARPRVAHLATGGVEEKLPLDIDAGVGAVGEVGREDRHALVVTEVAHRRPRVRRVGVGIGVHQVELEPGVHERVVLVAGLLRHLLICGPDARVIGRVFHRLVGVGDPAGKVFVDVGEAGLPAEVYSSAGGVPLGGGDEIGDRPEGLAAGLGRAWEGGEPLGRRRRRDR